MRFPLPTLAAWSRPRSRTRSSPRRRVRCASSFRREESAFCSEQVVFPAFGNSAALPQGERVAVDLLPQEPGEYEFTCGMGMLRGALVVEGAEP